LSDVDLINSVFTKEAKLFITTHLKEDTKQLRLKFSKKTDLPYSFLINQIEARQKLAYKNPSWSNNPNLVFPKKLSIEQSSSEITANYKTQIVKGNTLIDLTGGLGIDSFNFSKVFKHVTYTELDETLCLIAERNKTALELTNIDVIHGDSLDILQELNTFDLIYVDPARRDQGKKLVSLQDCFPNVVSSLDLLIQHSNQVLIKASPFLDIRKGVEELRFVKEIHVVSVKNDCKELLFLLENNYKDKPIIFTTNYLSNTKTETLSTSYPDEFNSRIGEVKEYLYLPNSAIMKAAIFGKLSNSFDLDKLHPNSNVYTSNIMLNNFTGRKFRVINTHPPYKQKFKGEYLNIITRNFKQKPEEIKKKLKCKDGGARYLFATTNNMNKSIFILCEKID